jgi:hypothetical protein
MRHGGHGSRGVRQAGVLICLEPSAGPSEGALGSASWNGEHS